MNLENKKQIATLLAAIGLGLIAVWLTGSYVQGQITSETSRLAKQYEKKNATLVNELTIMGREMKKLAVNQRAIAKKASEIRVVQASPDAPRPKDISSFSGRTPAGKRAITISIDSLSAIGGLIKPGDYVDIIGKLKVPDTIVPSKTQNITTVLFQNLQILAVGTNFKPTSSPEMYVAQQRARALSVTLAADPNEAGLLTFAQANGKLQMILRSPDEKETKPMEVASWVSLQDYVKNKQGTELVVPKKKAKIKEIDEIQGDKEVPTFIQIFRGGRQ